MLRNRKMFSKTKILELEYTIEELQNDKKELIDRIHYLQKINDEHQENSKEQLRYLINKGNEHYYNPQNIEINMVCNPIDVYDSDFIEVDRQIYKKCGKAYLRINDEMFDLKEIYFNIKKYIE